MVCQNGRRKKTLVVYYSATGTTKSVAEMIADEADADHYFEILEHGSWNKSRRSKTRS